MTKQWLRDAKARLRNRLRTVAVMDDADLKKEFERVFPYLPADEYPVTKAGYRARLLDKALEDVIPDAVL